MSEQPWFIRIRTPFNYRIEPYSRPGWIATGVFVVGAVLIGHLPAAGIDTRVEWVAWSIGIAGWTIGFLVIAFRHSEAAEVTIRRNVDTRRRER